MSFPSKFKGKCKDCGKEWPAKEPISKNSNGNWCKDGEHCQACQQTTGSSKPAETTQAPEVAPTETVEFESSFASLRNFTRDEVQKIKTIEGCVLDDLGKDANVQKVGMYVKEIYRSWSNKK